MTSGASPAQKPSPHLLRLIPPLYMGGLILLYVFVSVHTPLLVIANAPHDDGLFISLGRYLSEWVWLGPFNQFTLMKGPGYPFFLALNNWLGTPISLTHALFHCAAVTIFAVIAQRFIRSLVVSGMLFTLLLWHPIALSVDLLRILRDRIYFDQLLILLAILLLLLFDVRDGRRTILLGALGGLVLGWFWLTREEGVWVLPGLGILVLAGALQAWREGKMLTLASALMVVVGVFAVTQLGFRAGNWWAYGKFVGVDFKETNFQRALGALDSVRSGGTKPFVSITHEAMRKVFAVSPSFASLAPYFEGKGRDWDAFGCQIYPTSCGEISSGWFMWALRAAAEEAGHFKSPSEASTFFGQIADEVEAACRGGALRCEPQLIAEMPPMTRQRLADGLQQSFGPALELLTLLDFSDSYSGLAQPSGSGGNAQALSAALRFLNYPLHRRSGDVSLRFTAYSFSGWYYRDGSDWISVAVTRPDGSAADVQVDRGDSPDIAKHFGDPRASLQRFIIRTDCEPGCLLRIEAAYGAEAERRFDELVNKAPYGFAVGQGTFYLDVATPMTDATYKTTPADHLANTLRALNSHLYKFPYGAIVGLGILAFVLCTLVHLRGAIWNACYMAALAFWTLALSRFGLLLFTHATALPALQLHYFAPTYFMIVCGACFSLAAWLQLRRSNAPGTIGPPARSMS